jgi:hypothetical protein
MRPGSEREQHERRPGVADIPAAELDHLEALANAATPGPWRHGGIGNLDHWVYRGSSTHARAQFVEDAAYIAACDPSTIKGLITAVRSSVLDVDALARALEGVTAMTGDDAERWAPQIAHEYAALSALDREEPA